MSVYKVNINMSVMIDSDEYEPDITRIIEYLKGIALKDGFPGTNERILDMHISTDKWTGDY